MLLGHGAARPSRQYPSQDPRGSTLPISHATSNSDIRNQMSGTDADIATIADLADKENLQSLPLRLTSAGASAADDDDDDDGGGQVAGQETITTKTTMPATMQGYLRPLIYKVTAGCFGRVCDRMRLGLSRERCDWEDWNCAGPRPVRHSLLSPALTMVRWSDATLLRCLPLLCGPFCRRRCRCCADFSSLHRQDDLHREEDGCGSRSSHRLRHRKV
eukprot:909712-Rhodomonas_salina.3